MATRSTAGKTPGKVLSNIIRFVDAARLREGGSLAAPDVRLSELIRDLLCFEPMFQGKNAHLVFEALWASTAARMALAHAFLGALRVVCDPRAIAPGATNGTAVSTSVAKEKALCKSDKPGSKTDAIPDPSNEVCKGAGRVLDNTAWILGRLFLFATGGAYCDVPVRNRAIVPAAAAETLEELLRGGCFFLVSRLIARGPSGFAAYNPDSAKAGGTPCPIKSAGEGATLVFTMVYAMLVVGTSHPDTCDLVLSPQLPACRLIDMWARAAADQEGSTYPNSPAPTVNHQTAGSAPSFALSVRPLLNGVMPYLLQHRSDGGEPLRAVLSGPCLQYLVALQAVSQLHAADGGTLYGLPPAAVLPPEAEGRGSGGGGRQQGPAVLSCGVLLQCMMFWESCITEHPRVPLGPLRNRCLVNLCMRLSWVALASLEGAEGAAAQPQTGTGGRRQEGQQQQQRGQGGLAAGSNASGAPPRVAAVALRQPLAAVNCMSIALYSLNLAVTVMQGLDTDPNHTTLSGICRGDGSGGGGADLQTACTRPAPSCGSTSGGGNSSSGCGGMQDASPLVTEAGGSPEVAAVSQAGQSADPRLCSRSFCRRWWPLAVEVVRAALRQPGGTEAGTLRLCCSILGVSEGVEDEGLELDIDETQDLIDGVQSIEEARSMSARLSAALDARLQHSDPVPLSTIPPGLAAALSAGLLPTLTDLVRSSCGEASGSVEVIDMAATSHDALSAAKNLARVYGVAQGGELLLLLSHADAGQAAALLTALAKASRGLMSAAADPWTDSATTTATMVLVMRVFYTFSSLVSGLFPPEKAKSAHCAWAWPRVDGGDGGGGSPAEAEAVAPAYRQMLRLASFALHTWLPVLARMHDLAALPHMQHAGQSLPQGMPTLKDTAAEQTERCMKELMERCVTLAARACRAAWRRGDARAAGSWRQLLQRSGCAARWVGAEVVAGWEAEGWWSGAVGQQGGVAAGAGVQEQQQGEEGRGQAGEGDASSEEEEEEVWPYPLPLAPCESAALLRT